MILSYLDAQTEAFHKLGTRPSAGWQNVVNVAARKLDMLNAATQLRDLKSPSGNRLETLRGDRTGQHSIRINDQWRLCFRWTANGPSEVAIVDYH